MKPKSGSSETESYITRQWTECPKGIGRVVSMKGTESWGREWGIYLAAFKLPCD